MLERVRLRPALLGAAVTTVGYFVATASLVPVSAGLLVDAGPAVAVAVVIGVTALAALIGGYVTVRALRRHGGYPQRLSALPTLVVMGVAASLVVIVMAAALMAAAGEPAVLAGAPAIVVTLTLAALPAVLLVRPAAEADGYVGRTTRARRLPALREDAGQGSLETVGVTTVAAILVAALIIAMVPGGTWLGDNVRTQLCRIATLGQGDCGAPTGYEAQLRPEPEHACTLSDTSDNRGMAVSVMWFTAENGALIRVEKLSDDTYRVSREASLGAGGQVDTGAGVTVTVDGDTYGGEVQASASALLNLGAGATWVVDEAEKDKLVDYLKSERNWESVQTTLAAAGPAGSFASALATGGRAAWNWLTDAYTPSMPDEYYGYAGIDGNAGAAATGLVQHAEAGVSTSSVLGSRLDTKNKRLTVYYEGQIDASAGYQSHLEGSEVGASGTVRPLVAVTYDTDGNPLSVQVQAMAAGEAKLTVGNMFGEPYLDENPNGGFIFDARVSITSDETRDIAMGLLKASGIATPHPVARYEGAASAVDTFVSAAKERGTLTRQTVNMEGQTDFGINANAKVAGVGLGASFENSTETINTSDADYWDGSRWRPWSSCLG